MDKKRVDVAGRMAGGTGGLLAVVGIALLAWAVLSAPGSPSTPVAQAQEGRILDIQKNSGPPTMGREYTITANLLPGESLQPGDMVRIEDNVDDDLTIVELFNVHAGWTCTIQPVNFIVCNLNVNSQLTQTQETIFQFRVCDPMGGTSSVDNDATIFLNNAVQDTDNANPAVPGCETPTATSTNTPTSTATNTPTNTPTSEATNTPTSTATSEATNTPTSTPTSEATNTPTSTPTSPAVATNTPTSTATSPAAATNTPTSTPTSPAAATNTPTSTPTSPAAATATPTTPAEMGRLVVKKECKTADSKGKLVSVKGQGPFLFELLSGAPPFDGLSAARTFNQFNLACGESQTLSGLQPGTFTVFEQTTFDAPSGVRAQQGFRETQNTCVGVKVQPGKTAECRITNEKVQPAVQATQPAVKASPTAARPAASPTPPGAAALPRTGSGGDGPGGSLLTLAGLSSLVAGLALMSWSWRRAHRV